MIMLKVKLQESSSFMMTVLGTSLLGIRTGSVKRGDR